MKLFPPSQSSNSVAASSHPAAPLSPSGAAPAPVSTLGVLAASTDTRTGFLVALPAMVAMMVAVGAGAFAMAHTVSLSEFTLQIWITLLVALAFCVVNCYGTMQRMRLPATDTKHRLWTVWQACAWLIAFAIALLPHLCVAIGSTAFVPADVVSDKNMLITVYMSWCTIGCVFAAGAFTGPIFGPRRPLPFSVALLPELSLFALLNIVSVDTPVTIAFIIYIAAALYLIAYENYLTRRPFAARDANGLEAAATVPTAATPITHRVRVVATHYAVACCVWLVVFSAGAGLFYSPLSVMLPGSFAVDFARAQLEPREETRDWRDATRVMELRGGSSAVSERPVLKVQIKEGDARALWRGRVYERYADEGKGSSRWEVTAAQDEADHEIIENPRRGWLDFKASKAPIQAGRQRALPPLTNGTTQRRSVVEAFQLLSGFSGGPAVPIYSSGEAVAVRASYNAVALRADGTARLVDREYGVRVFMVRSQITEPNLSQLGAAPGLPSAEMRDWKQNRFTADTIQLPQGETGQRIRTIAAQIQQEALQNGRPLRTPYQKASAIGRYLIDNCEYSLAAPAVPSGQDSVLFFLTQSRLGACDMFASAEALLLRALDVPTRVASGFRQPESSIDGQPNTYLAREQDAHAWVEYFVPSLGWVTYDPTDGTREANDSLGVQVMHFFQWSPLRTQGRVMLLPTLGALLMAIGGVWMLVDKRATSLARVRRTRSADDQMRESICTTYGRARHILSGHVPASAGQTPYEFENSVLSSSLKAEAKQELSALTFLFVMANYATAPLNETVETANLRESLRRLRRALR